MISMGSSQIPVSGHLGLRDDWKFVLHPETGKPLYLFIELFIFQIISFCLLGLVFSQIPVLITGEGILNLNSWFSSRLTPFHMAFL